VIGLTLGTGVGSAFLVDGLARHSGPGIPPRGRLDLLEVGGHPLEDTISRRAIRARYHALTGGVAAGRLDARDIALLARTGDRTAQEALEQPLRALGRVLTPWTLAFGASILVVGGSIALAWDLVAGPLRSGMSDAAPGWPDQVRIVPGGTGNEAALLGAAWHAIHTESIEPRG